MEISYLCAARVSDVLSQMVASKREEGILSSRERPGLKQIKVWTERFHNAIELAKLWVGGKRLSVAAKKQNILEKAGFNDL